MDEVLKDERFSHIAKDPRFWQMPKKERKVKIDKRFQAMFHDKKFQVKHSVDKRGRPIDVSSKDNLRRFYDISDDSDDEQAKKSGLKKKKKKLPKKGDSTEENTKPEKKSDSDILVKKSKSVKTKSDIGKTSSNVVNEKNEKNKKKSLEINLNESDNDDNDDDIQENKSDISKKNELNVKTKKKNIDINLNESDDDEDEDDDDDENSESDDNKVDDVDDDQNSHNDEIDEDEGNDYEESDDDDDEESDSDEVDLSRGIGGEEESSSEEDFEFDADDNFDHNWMELEKDIPEIKDASNRLAVCNLDWDRIKAEDIYMLFNSFKPPNGYIQSVSIYPSEFGKERMKEEEFQGPKELTEKSDVNVPQTPEEILEGEQFHREKLRQYQLNRLRYYYAVIVCDSKDTAIKLYDECDGKEFETSCTKIDLRFIPDGMEFEDKPRSVCTGVNNYKPNYFANSALGRSQVKLTWDDTDHDRLQVTMTKIDPKKIEQLEKDYEAYIASSSDEEDAGLPGSNSSDSNSDNSDTEENRLQKYRQLLQDIDEKKTKKEDDIEMEITWEPGLRETTQNLVKKSQESETTVTPWQKFLQKKKDKKKERKKERKEMKEKALVESGIIPEEKTAFSDDELPEGIDIHDSYFKSEIKDGNKNKKKKGKKEELTEEELEKKKQEEAKLALLMMDDEDDSKHFNLEKLIKDGQKKKKKNKKKKNDDEDDDREDDFKVNVEDPRFTALFDSHLYNVDPSAPEYKKTKGSEAFINEKQKRRQKEGYSKPLKRKKVDDNTVTDELKPKSSESISHLVQSVKAKTQKFKNKQKKVS